MAKCQFCPKKAKKKCVECHKPTCDKHLKDYLCELCRIDVEEWEHESLLGTVLSLDVLEEIAVRREDEEDADD